MRIFLFPYGGLANRMRAIDSAMNLSFMHLHKKLTVIWYKEPGMNCYWHDVFAPVSFIKDQQLNKITRYVFRYGNDKWFLRVSMKLLQRIHVLCLMDLFDGSKVHEIEDLLYGKYLFMVIRACIGFCPKEDFHKELFVIKDTRLLQKEISKIDDNTIGVHIRRADNVYSIRRSPLELFDRIMKKEIEDDSSVRFYLCSDDESVKNYFRSPEWKNKCVIPDGVVDRNSIEGIVQAACELQALAACKKIYGCYGSSFSKVAARFGGIENIVLSVE